jgi:SpoVK/Ycf46/Vps4 family AAA+-type ATPase
MLWIREDTKKSPPPSVQSRDVSPETERAREADPYETAFVPRDPRKTLRTLVIPESAFSGIEREMKLFRQRRKLREWGVDQLDPRALSIRINLFGPEGTGKTHAAEGIAHELNIQLIDVQLGDILSKYVGDSEKSLAGAFRVAARTGALLLFNEADSLLSRRRDPGDGMGAEHHNALRNAMITHLDAFDGIVVFTTNRQRVFDPAFKSRIRTHIAFALPDRTARLQMWTRHLLPTIPREQTVDPIWLAEESEGLSGRDVVHVMVLAAVAAVDRPLGKDRVLAADIRQAMSDIRSRNQDVAIESRNAVTETVPENEIPAEVREKLREKREACA